MVLVWIIAAVMVVVVAFGAWVRLAPLDAARFHTDPVSAEAPGDAGWLVRPEGGDAAWPRFDRDAAALLAAFDTVARGTPRTTAIAGSLAEGQITYVTRSRIWGFPDYTTVRAVPVNGGATLAILARARFGKSDMGVNRARVKAWYDALSGS